MSLTIRERIAAWGEQNDEELPLWADCDDAIVGIASRSGMADAVVYDYEKLVHVFEEQGMSREDAEEWVAYNILGAGIGPSTPLVLFTP